MDETTVRIFFFNLIVSVGQEFDSALAELFRLQVTQEIIAEMLARNAVM